ALCFFFSSRRRHTRSYGDWSSDVCSSDLSARATADSTGTLRPSRLGETSIFVRSKRSATGWSKASVTAWAAASAAKPPICTPARSEERRVGKEGRGRGVQRWGKENDI